MIIDEQEFSIVKELVAEINAMISYNLEAMTSIDVVQDHARISFLAGQTATLKDMLDFIKDKEDNLKKGMDQ